MMCLRPLRDEDVTQIRDWPPYPGDMAQMDYALRERGWLEEFRSKTGATVYAVDDGDGVIAFTILAKTGRAEAEFRIALRAEKTGLGLGEVIIVETLRKGFTEHGLSRIHLIVRKNNLRGIGLYRRIGFVERGESRKDIQGESVEFIRMEIGCEEFARRRETGNAAGGSRRKGGTMKTEPKRALVVIDVQNDYAGGNLPIEFPPVASSLANIARAMDAARAAAVPVVVVQNVLSEGAPIMARGTMGAELHDAVGFRGWDHLVTKNLPSAFCGTGLQEWLRAHGIDTIVIAGYMTHNCDLATALDAFHAGFAVEFLSDATGSVPYANRAGRASAEDIHRIVTVVLQARFAAVMETSEWISLLQTGAEPERDSIFASNRRARLAESV